MVIDASSTRISVDQRTANQNARAGSGASFSASLAGASAAAAAATTTAAHPARSTQSANAGSAISPTTNTAASQPPDFTGMTRKELFDWMNGQIRSGQMTMDQSIPFLGMSMQVQVNAGDTTPLDINGTERIDFLQVAQTGISDAQLRQDSVTEKMLVSALSTMRRHQGETSSPTTLDRFAKTV
jgi:hypothetical protein